MRVLSVRLKDIELPDSMGVRVLTLAAVVLRVRGIATPAVAPADSRCFRGPECVGHHVGPALWLADFCALDAILLVLIMTPASSVSFFRSEFDDFLYAAVGVERNEMPLSVLSMLVRLNLDPWKEAADLSELPKDTATERLTMLIARLPGGRWAQADLRAIADRLIALLPRLSHSSVPSIESTHSVRDTGSAVARILFRWLKNLSGRR
jgi:hypothetical protein